MTDVPKAQIDQRVKRWMHLTSSTIPYQLKSISITGSNVFVDQIVQLSRATAIVGSHGAGKSLLLRMIEAAFGYSSQQQVPPFVGNQYSPVRIDGVVEATLRTPNGLVSHATDLSQPPEDRAEAWQRKLGESFVASCAEPYSALSWLSFMYENYNFASKRGSRDSERDLSRAELDALRSILGRAYDRVTVRSAYIDDGAGDDLHLPFISAILGSKAFDNTAMSQGELWVHYLNWFLEYDVHEGELALIDEPETFLSARGRRPLIDRIAQLVLGRGLQLIIGTHSPEILSRFPLANIRMCIANDAGVRLVTPASRFQIREYIGIQTPVSGLILVEDALAVDIIRTIFAQYDTALTSEAEIIQCGGAAEVNSGVRILRKSNRLICVGVLDADEKGEPTDSHNSIAFLPGAKSPEGEIFGTALERPQQVAKMMNVNADSVLVAIGSCRDLDHQYRLGAVARQLGYSELALQSALIQIWLRRPEIAREAELLTRMVRGKLNAGAIY